MKNVWSDIARAALAAGLVFVAAPNAQEKSVSGVVFADANANGARDAGERGIANVAVSNQDAVDVTDADGRYQIESGTHGLVFVSMPDGYRSVGAFWRKVTVGAPTADFALAPIPRTDSFTFVHGSDTHIAPPVAARMQKFRELAEAEHPAFVIISGDLVKDALRVGETEATGYYDLFDRETALFKEPVWTVPGNHENFGIERDKSNVTAEHPLYGRKMYHAHRGPDYYSFNYGGVHFVGLNTVDIDDQWYYGHVDSRQLAWLAADLALVPGATPVVTFDHIPFFSSIDPMGGYVDGPPAPTLITVNGKTMFRHTVSNAADVLAVLRTHNHVLALGGHMHSGEKISYNVDGRTTRFNQAPAIVGPNTAAAMQFTSGFTVYTVKAGVIDDGRLVTIR